MALAINPQHEAAQANLTSLLRRRGEYDKIETANQKSEGDGKSAISCDEVGLAYLDKSKYDQAIVEFKKAVNIQPDAPEFQTHLGLAYYKKGDYANAAAFLRKSASNLGYAGRDKANFNLGLAYQSNKEYVKAIEAYKEVLLIDPTMTEAKGNLVSCYIDQIANYAKNKNYEGVLNCYKGIQKYQPETPNLKKNLVNAYNNYGVLLMNDDRLDAAIEKFSSALQVDPGFTLAQENLAVAYLNKGVEYAKKNDAKKAIDLFNKAVAASPSSEAARTAKENIKNLKGQ
jgi:tetratricopeptide (TPR) repeat protein